MAKVIILNDIYSENVKYWSRYLGPYPLASILQDELKISTVVIDYFLKIPDFFSYIDKFIDIDTEWIGLSSTFLVAPSFKTPVSKMNFWFSNHNEICEWFENLKKIVKQKKSNAKILVGGHCVDIFFKHYVVNKKKPPPIMKFIDYFVHGYGEDIVKLLYKKDISSFHVHTVGTSCFISDDKRAGSGARIVPTVYKHNMAISDGEWLPLEISKGCKFSCRFCFYDQKGAITKNKSKLREELLRNYELFGTTGYVFSDDTINDSPKKMEMLCDTVLSLPFDIEWISYARPDMFYAYPDFIDAVKKTGVRGLFLGIETLNVRAGRIAGKGLNPEKILMTIDNLRNSLGSDCFLLGSFIIGLVGETEESLNQTLSYLTEQRTLDQVQYEILFVREADSRINSGFSSNLEKYGFKRISWNPRYYWEHETLNYDQCKEIALNWKKSLASHPFTSVIHVDDWNASFWSYPMLRTLKYSHKEAINFIKWGTKDNTEIKKKYNNFITLYHKKLVSQWIINQN